MTLREAQARMADEMNILDDWLDKYTWLVAMSERLPPMNPSRKIREYRFDGCQSNVWIDIRCEDGVLYLSLDSEPLILKGILAIVVMMLNGRRAQEIEDTDLTFLEDTGIADNLSPVRTKGMKALLAHIVRIADTCMQ